VHIFTKNGAVLLGEVNVLEDTVGWRNYTGLDEKSTGEAAFIQRNDFAGFDLTNEFRSYHIECAALAGDDITAFLGSADAQRPDTTGVSGRLNPVGEQEQKTIRALQMV